jgi:hypothetical protein
MAILNILRTFGIVYDRLVYFEFILYISPLFGIMQQEKSGNPGRNALETVFGRVPHCRSCSETNERFDFKLGSMLGCRSSKQFAA